MIRVFFLCLTIMTSINIIGQEGWTLTKLANLPKPTANNALTEALINNKKFVYSFGGISDSLYPQNIHQDVYKYEVSTNQWDSIVQIPDSLGKIGMGASFVDNKIYLIGGHYVDEDGNELTSNKVHVFNPFLDTFEVDAANLPTPTDNHVQSVWRDSLIYVITGWSNTENIPDVQIYNPSFNSWTMGTSLPDNDLYMAFGASGYILGDTIFYFGGVSGTTDFSATSHLRKGVINPDDPTDINWVYVGQVNGISSYRPACSGHKSTLFCFGGAPLAYNFNAIDYTDSSIVNPMSRIIMYNSDTDNFNFVNTTLSGMDYRGMAKLGGGNWLVAGGIDSLQQVSNRTILLHNKELSNIDEALQPPFFEVYEKDEHYLVLTENVGDISVFDISGRKLYHSRKHLADLKINKSYLESNILLFVYNDGSNVPVTRKVVLVK